MENTLATGPNQFIQPTLDKFNKLGTEKAPNQPPTPEPTDPNRLKTDYEYDNNDLPTYGQMYANAIGEKFDNAARITGNAISAMKKTPGVIAKMGEQAAKSTTRKLYTGLVSAPAKAAVMGYKGVLKPVGRAINNTTRKWVEGKAPIRLRNQELKEALDKFKGIENQWADFHYNENSSMITLTQRVEAAWQYHKDVIRNVVIRGHAVLLLKNGKTPVPPPGMNEAEWKTWLADTLQPKRQKWLDTNKGTAESVRGLKYDSMGLTHTTMTTDSIQTFFQYLDKGYDDPEPVFKESSLDDIQPLEPQMVSTPPPPPVVAVKKPVSTPNKNQSSNFRSGDAGLGLGGILGALSGGGAAMYEDTFFQSADKYDIAFQGFPDKKFHLKTLVDKNLALESVLERFGVPKNTAQTNFSKSQASPLIQSLKSVLFYPEAVEATPQEEREYGSDVLARVSTALKDDQMNVLNEDGFLPDLFVKSTSDLMPNFYFRRYLPGQKLFPYPGQKPHLTISDNMMNLAV
jgi:hypothetical protein